MLDECLNNKKRKKSKYFIEQETLGLVEEKLCLNCLENEKCIKACTNNHVYCQDCYCDMDKCHVCNIKFETDINIRQ